MKPSTGRPWQHLGVSARVGWLLVAAYGVAEALVVASWRWGWRGPYGTRPVDEIVTVACLLCAAGCAANAARHAVGRSRFGWLALATALVGWAAGEVVWAVYDVRPDLDHATHPAAAEVVLLLYPIGAMAAVVAFSHVSRNTPPRMVLDGLILATSLFVISWVFVFEKQLREASGSRLSTLTEVFIDIILVTTAIMVLSRVRPSDGPSRSLVPAGIGTIGLADIAVVFHTGIGSYHTGDVGDLTRVAGLGLLTWAGLAGAHESPTPAAPDDAPYRTRLWLPYLPLLLAAAVGLGHALGHMQHGPMLAALGILVAAVLARQFVVLVENQRLLTEVAREAFRDSLTGLANRARFVQRLNEAIARPPVGDAPIAVLCLDLDNFKLVNDALGHPAGDELLVRVAERLTAAVDESATVARLGGDEFAVLIEASVEESQATAHRVLDAFTPRILIDGVPLDVRPSIGFTVAPASSGCTVDELLRHADLAMYAAKRQGGRCVHSFVPDVPLTAASPEATGPVVSAVSVTRPRRARRLPETSADAEVTARSVQETSTDAPEGIRWPPTAVRIAIGALAIGVVAFAALSALTRAGQGHPAFVGGLYAALNLSAAALVAARAVHVTANRFAWALIAAGMAISAVGDVVYAAWVPDGQSPSVADPEYLAFYPLVYAGLLLLMRARLERVPVVIRLDSVTCGLAMAAVAAALLAGPVHTAALRQPSTVLVGLLYPWSDLLLLALATSMLPILGSSKALRWSLLVGGFVLFAAADTVYLFETSARAYRVGTALDACWPASSLLVAAAAWARSARGPISAKRGLGSFAVPVSCTVVAVAVTVLGHGSRPATTLAALSLVVVATRFAVTFRDISVLAEDHKRAMTDKLTGLPNRRSLVTVLTEVSAPQPAPATKVVSRRALLLLELYEFHEINGSIGAAFVDELLCRIANRLGKTIRRDDLFARVGDSRFAILLAEGTDLIAARAQAGRLLECLSEPFALDPITVRVDARIAIALCPDHCDHPQELLGLAEAAIPHARSAVSKIAVYEAAFELYRDNDPNLIEELRAALDDGDELTCHYQPKINLDGSVHSVEALLRWHHPDRGLLLPAEFVPAAERAGLMRKIADRTLNLVLEQMRSWRARGLTLTVAVNLSTTNLLDLDLVGTIERLLRAHDVPAEALIIEITESTLIDSMRSRHTVASLQRLGIHISLDDYGTGWSSLARLQDVSVDELKLDRVFVARLAHDPRSVAIVRSTVALAENLGADLVAEGVEDEVTLDALRRYGCTITQGFVHSPPLPGDELPQWIADHAPAGRAARQPAES
ncbi:diguanylate cyclase domain-containing protein [Mycobacterium sp. HUMS_1102779]|uniref:diguanylate cyclase domain-containing protein n=1 Tax=Mycobacterium sp. HUMS_1102779 TaxID=3383487 RepID=UPI003899D949